MNRKTFEWRKRSMDVWQQPHRQTARLRMQRTPLQLSSPTEHAVTKARTSIPVMHLKLTTLPSLGFLIISFFILSVHGQSSSSGRSSSLSSTSGGSSSSNSSSGMPSSTSSANYPSLSGYSSCGECILYCHEQRLILKPVTNCLALAASDRGCISVTETNCYCNRTNAYVMIPLKGFVLIYSIERRSKPTLSNVYREAALLNLLPRNNWRKGSVRWETRAHRSVSRRLPVRAHPRLPLHPRHCRPARQRRVLLRRTLPLLLPMALLGCQDCRVLWC